MINNEKLNPIVTELFVRCKKLNVSIVFITQSYFRVLKDVRLNSNKTKLQQIALNHSSNIDFKDFMTIYRKCTTEPNSFTSDSPLKYRNNLLK